MFIPDDNSIPLQTYPQGDVQGPPQPAPTWSETFSSSMANENDVQIWLSKAMKLSGAENANDEARSVLDYFARRSGLLLPRGEGQFAFMHLSLQEYFAACYLEQHLAAPRFSAISQPTDPSDEALLSWTDEPSWRETFVLTFEKLAEKPNHSESLLKHLFDSRVVKKSPAGKSSAMQLLAWSQDAVSHTSTTVTTKTNNFEIEPWMWIVGGAVLLVIIVALLRGNSSKEVSRTTVIKNDSV